jgi:hypothetical protein
MRDLCVVDAEWLYEAAPDYFRRKLRTARNWTVPGCCQHGWAWSLDHSCLPNISLQPDFQTPRA